MVGWALTMNGDVCKKSDDPDRWTSYMLHMYTGNNHYHIRTFQTVVEHVLELNGVYIGYYFDNCIVVCMFVL